MGGNGGSTRRTFYDLGGGAITLLALADLYKAYVVVQVPKGSELQMVDDAMPVDSAEVADSSDTADTLDGLVDSAGDSVSFFDWLASWLADNPETEAIPELVGFSIKTGADGNDSSDDGFGGAGTFVGSNTTIPSSYGGFGGGGGGGLYINFIDLSTDETDGFDNDYYGGVTDGEIAALDAKQAAVAAAGGGSGGSGGYGGGDGGGDGGGGASADESTAQDGTDGARGGFGGGGGGGAGYGSGGGGGFGGAIFNSGSSTSVTLTNSTFSGNEAKGGDGGAGSESGGKGGAGFGGAIFNLNGSVTTDSATLAFNSVEAGEEGAEMETPEPGGETGESEEEGPEEELPGPYPKPEAEADGSAVYSLQQDGSPSLALKNSILADSTDGYNDCVNGGGSATADHVLIQNDSGCGASADPNSIVGQDPELDPNGLQNNGGPTETIALQDGSPAMNTGSTTLSVDQRGYTRLVGDDIGAFEYGAAPPPPAPDEPDLQTASDTGQSSTDDLTNDSSPTFDISGVETGATVELLRDGAVVARETSTPGGTVSLTDSDVPDGGHEYTSGQQTPNGGASPASPGLSVTINTKKPTVESIEPQDLPALQASPGELLYYEVTFDKAIDPNTVQPSDFKNYGTATISVGRVTASSPEFFKILVTPASAGSLELGVQQGANIQDFAGNTLDTTTGNPKDVYTVTVGATATAITSHQPDPSYAGQAVEVGFSVTALANSQPAAGTVTIQADGDDPVESCSDSASANGCQLTLKTSGNRTLTATYQPAADAVGPAFVASSAQVTHTVEEPEFVSFSAAGYEVDENAGSTTITVERSSGTDGAVTVGYATSDGSAKAGKDYAATSGTLTFTDGQASASFKVQISDEAKDEGAETVNLTLSDPQGASADAVALGEPNTAVLTVEDNDKPRPSAEEHTYSVKRGEGLTVGQRRGVLEGATATGVGGGLTARLVSSPKEGGRVSLKPDGSFVYTPKKGFVGTEQFSYKACNPKESCSVSATVTINVKNKQLPSRSTSAERWP